MTHFNDNAALCMTGMAGPMDIDYFRPEERSEENWIDWDGAGDESIPIIGWIDAPTYFPAGCCISDDSILSDGPEQAIVRR